MSAGISRMERREPFAGAHRRTLPIRLRQHYVGTPLVKDAWDRAHELIETNDVPPLPDDVRRHISELIAGYLRGRD